jgi:hypothetical protein
MQESTQIIISIVIIVVGYILTTLGTGWWTRQVCLRIIKELEDKEAFNAATAVSLPYSHAKTTLFNFGYRNYRLRALEVLLLGEVVTKTLNDLYYLNKDKLLKNQNMVVK